MSTTPPEDLVRELITATLASVDAVRSLTAEHQRAQDRLAALEVTCAHLSRENARLTEEMGRWNLRWDRAWETIRQTRAIELLILGLLAATLGPDLVMALAARLGGL